MAPKRAVSVSLSVSPCKEASFEPQPPLKKRRLQIVIPPPEDLVDDIETDDDPLAFLSATSSESLDSLFDNVEQESALPEGVPVALRYPSPSAIEGLYFDPTLLLPTELATEVFDFCQKTYFQTPGANQVMLFGRFPSPSSSSPLRSSAGFPLILISLLETLEGILRPSLPPEAFDLLFPQTPTQARQAIINLYTPGEGITPHVDLLGRYSDGIIGVSFGSGCVMRFDEVASASSNPCGEGSGRRLRRHDLFLPERSVLVLSRDARYRWTHGIEKRTHDLVLKTTPCRIDEAERGPPIELQEQEEWVKRGTRLSVTFRWMLQGADIVGEG